MSSFRNELNNCKQKWSESRSVCMTATLIEGNNNMNYVTSLVDRNRSLFTSWGWGGS